MKCYFLIFLLSTTTCIGQVLTPKAQRLREKNLQQFHAIEFFAFKKWNNNEIRRIKEINEQIDAFLEVRKLVLGNFRWHQACMKAVRIHSKKRERKNPFHNPTIDWKKVLFELQNWINPKGAY